MIEMPDGKTALVETTYSIDKVESKVRELKEFAKGLKYPMMDVKTVGILSGDELKFGSYCFRR